jgi:hypothetical protein
MCENAWTVTDGHLPKRKDEDIIVDVLSYAREDDTILFFSNSESFLDTMHPE